MSTMQANGPGDEQRNRGAGDRYPGKLVRELRDAWRGVMPFVVDESRGVVRTLRRRWWLRMTRRRQHAFVVICGVMLAVGVGLVVHETEPKARGRALPSPVVLGVPSRIEQAKHPVVVPVRTTSAGEIATLSTSRRRGLTRRTAAKILPAIEANPERVAVIKLLDLPLSFAALPYPDRRQLEQQADGDPAERYETAVAELLDDLIDEIEREQPRAILSVHGLPVEPEEAGTNLRVVQQTNDRYDGVIERVGPFVPARRFVVFGSSLDERSLAKMGMREALRLRDGRPIIFQTNLVWQALVDEKPRRGRHAHLEAVLTE